MDDNEDCEIYETEKYNRKLREQGSESGDDDVDHLHYGNWNKLNDYPWRQTNIFSWML